LTEVQKDLPQMDGLDELFRLLLATTGVDFRDYKQTTVRRRLSRRMAARGLSDCQDYLSFCRTQPSEVEVLFRDLLISVTQFFRDRGPFDALSCVAADIVAGAGGPVRIWVAGCATGQEAFSIAALFAEAMGGVSNLEGQKLQIFATDIDEAALSVARAGRYPVSAADDIPAALLERYFCVQNDTLVVRKALRDVIRFSRHDLVQDPPFQSMDLVVLRNVLIYFNLRLQTGVLRAMHLALNDSGHLFLGASEHIGPKNAAFEPMRDAERIFRKRPFSPNGNQIAKRGFTSDPRPKTIASITTLTSIKLEKEMSATLNETGTTMNSAADHQRQEKQAMTREALQQLTEELKTSNEELRALNAQLQTANERLQATNEEYETSNEELQSTNEALITVNEELHEYSDETRSSSAALNSVLTTWPSPIVVVDTAMRITNASDAACDLFHIPHTSGAVWHLSQCHVPKSYPALAEAAKTAMTLRQDQVVRFEFGGARNVLRVVPILDKHDRLHGATLIFSQASMAEAT